MPEAPDPKCYPEAVFDYNEWSWVGWRGADGEEYGEIAWPFDVEWADKEDMELLGFSVVPA
jgi:hypothetical protein